MSNKLVSIIIPCFNQGQFIMETLESVLKQKYKTIEIIIINDGSTDNYTNQLLNSINQPSVKVISTANQGLAETRNTGIKNSNGFYILPLDSDDKISENYINNAVEILDNNPKIGIVYGSAEYFGEKTGQWPLEQFDLNKMIFYNQIYASGLYRRSDYNKTIGYDGGMKYGWEDWDFWLSLLEQGLEVFFINHTCFYYRITKGSMVQRMNEEHRRFLRQRIYSRHSSLYNHLFTDPLSLYEQKRYLEEELDKGILGTLQRKIRLFNKRQSY